jgi:predicted PolB exonuclease-like 3'-5' exonuclease
MAPILTFDIETVPDVAGIRRLNGFGADASDADVAQFAFQARRSRTGSDFLQHHLQRVVSIGCSLRSGDTFRVWSLGTPQDGEAELIRRFYEGVERYTPQIVSWNGGGFDLPVLHYRAMIHGIAAPRYWDMGDDNRDFRFNNYIGRYHTRHLDLMDLLAMYQARGYAPLDELAQLCGLPGKLGMDGSQVWQAFQDGKIDDIRNYCETDVVNTYLLFLRFQHMRGHLDEVAMKHETGLVRATLDKAPEPHWKEFVAAWDAASVAGTGAGTGAGA